MSRNEIEAAELEAHYRQLLAAFEMCQPDARDKARAALASAMRRGAPEPHIARLRQLERRKIKPSSNPVGSGPTPETLAQADGAQALYRDGEGGASAVVVTRSHGDSLQRLRLLHVLTPGQVWAGREIASIFDAVTRGLVPRAMPLTRGHGGRGGGISLWLAVLHLERYRPWCAAVSRLHGRKVLALTVAVAAEGRSLRSQALRHGMHYRTARTKLAAALELYERRADATDHLDEADEIRAIGRREEAALADEKRPGR